MVKLGLDLRSMVHNVLLRDGGENACRLCFSVPTTGHLFLAERVELRVPYCTGSVRLADILTAVTKFPLEEDVGLPEGVCMVCAGAAIDAYLFLRFCTHSARKWRELHTTIEEAYTRVSREGECASSALFVFVENDQTTAVVDSPPASLARADTSRVLRRARCVRARQQRRTAQRARTARERHLQCEDCGKTFAVAASLARHTATHARTFTCSHCHKTFPSMSVVNMHVTRMHTPKRIACADCPKLFASRPLLTAHRTEMHTFVDCTHCGKTYSRHSLRKHEQTHGPRVSCDKCGGQFRTGDALRAHGARCPAAAAASPRRRVACALCTNTYSCRGTLQQHIKYAHGDAPNACTVCGKKYMDKNKLRWHMATHTGVKSFHCNKCDTTFKQANTLKYHMRARHTGERPYACELCPETFITSFRRTEHRRRRHGAPAPACCVCAARFTTPARLNRHMRKHAPPTHT